MSGFFTASAPGALPLRPMGGSRAPAATIIASGMSISNAIALFIVIALIALIVVIVLAIRMWHSPGLRSARAQRIKEAAAADVAEIEEDDAFVSPDAPGRHEDEL
jgi:predicted lipid-binding transport protein (Tim44 family)